MIELQQQAVLALLRSWLAQAMMAAEGYVHVRSVKVYAWSPVPEAIFIEFDIPGCDSRPTLAYLPAPSDEIQTIKAAFVMAFENMADLPEITDADLKLKALRAALYQLESPIIEGSLRYRFSAENKRIVYLSQLALNHSASQAQTPININFRDLALDFLSGASVPPGYAMPHSDIFEVYAYEGDPYSSVIVRNFDQGSSFAGAILEIPGPTIDKFTQVTDHWLRLRRYSPVSEQLRNSDISGLKILDTASACERLGRALGAMMTHANGYSLAELGVCGQLSQSALEEIKTIQQRLPRDDDTETSYAFTMLGGACESLKALDGEPIWSTQLERDNETRVEVLTHTADPETVVLLSLSPKSPEVHGAWSIFVPGDDPVIAERISLDLKEMIASRGIMSKSVPGLLDKRSPFKRIPTEQVETRLKEALEIYENTEVGLYEQVSPNLKNTESQLLKTQKSVLMPQGPHSLH